VLLTYIKLGTDRVNCKVANRIVAAPPTSRGTPCIMLSNVTGAQVSDTTDDASSNVAGNIKNNQTI